MQTTFSKIVTFENRRSGCERLTVVVEHPAADVRIELERDAERASVSLSADELGRLSRVLDSMAARRMAGVRDPSETFHGDDGEALVVTRTNWGEPYETGASFSLRGAVELRVEMPDSELFSMRKVLNDLVAEPSSGVTMGRSLR